MNKAMIYEMIKSTIDAFYIKYVKPYLNETRAEMVTTKRNILCLVMKRQHVASIYDSLKMTQ
jgi:hypothetical protein